MTSQPLDLDDTIWLQQRPCGCVVAAAIAVVPGDRTLATAEQAGQHFNPTSLDRSRAATARLTIAPVASAVYRERYRASWCCDQHTRPSA
ncbi:hypothetical protein AB0F36_14425 [Streptomyces sp. NPDC029080]|uniref:hypothetical protein n=1 Tax=Streptomyces sp. NPDC029080 TaxID=3155017 RepID=UPI0034026DC7